MGPMAKTLGTDKEIDEVVAYIKTFPINCKKQKIGKGNPIKGKALYTTCIACHGNNGKGNKLLNSPSLANQYPWYLYRQLKGFQAGYRGTNPKDTYGAQMRPMSMTLTSDEAVHDVVAYILTLSNKCQ